MRGGALWETREARAEPLDDALRALLDRDDARVVVGTIDEAVVGFGIVEIEHLRDGTRLGVIAELYVEPEARGGRGGGGDRRAARRRSAPRPAASASTPPRCPVHREAKNFFERSGFTARALIMHHKLDAARRSG